MAGNDAYTKLLIHSNTTNGSTVFVDSSSSARTVSKGGSPAHSTAAQKFGTTSIHFSGNEYLSLADSDDFHWEDGDFTVDFQIKRTTSGLLERVCGQTHTGYQSACVNILADDTLQTRFYSSAGVASAVLTSTTTITDTNWHHIAVVRSGDDFLFFIDGALEDSGDVTGLTAYNIPSVFGVGANGGFAYDEFTGYIDEFRISKGIARWDSAFTPPTEAYHESIPVAIESAFVLGVETEGLVGSAVNIATTAFKLWSSVWTFKESPAEIETNFVLGVKPTIGIQSYADPVTDFVLGSTISTQTIDDIKTESLFVLTSEIEAITITDPEPMSIDVGFVLGPALTGHVSERIDSVSCAFVLGGDIDMFSNTQDFSINASFVLGSTVWMETEGVTCTLPDFGSERWT